MKKQRMSLNSIKNVLSRAEMRNIMAGSGGGGSSGHGCSNSSCTVYDGIYTYPGLCGTGYGGCLCMTRIGQYTPNGGVSHCAY
jgi:hypothetical protein